MGWHSITHYSEITGIGRRTIKNRLSDLEMRPGERKAHLYDSVKALPLIYQIDSGNLDPRKESALLSQARRKKIDLERREIEGALMSSEFVVEMCSILASNVRDKFLAMPNSIKNRFPMLELSVIEDIDDMIRNALNEMANDGMPPRLKAKMSSYLSRIERLEKFESSEKENELHEAPEVG